LGADQLAVVAGEAVVTVGANLAVMVDGKNVFGGAERTTLRDFRGGIGSKAGIQGMGKLRQHARQISMEEWPPAF
jgi:hypothetical protein